MDEWRAGGRARAPRHVDRAHPQQLLRETVLAPTSGEILVRGGRFFPDFTRVRVSGSSLGGGCLKLRGIYAGYLLELEHEGMTVRTTRIQAVDRAVRPVVH